MRVNSKQLVDVTNYSDTIHQRHNRLDHYPYTMLRGRIVTMS